MPHCSRFPLVNIHGSQAIIISSRRSVDFSILQSTKLVVFLGTPHRGSHVLDTSLAKAGLSFMRFANKEIPRNVKTMLQPRADESFIINTDFIRAKGPIEIVNFYEQVARPHLQDLVVDKDSAVFGSERSEDIPVARDHEHLVRFESCEDDAYCTLQQTLERKVTKILDELAEVEDEKNLDRLRKACLSSLGQHAPLSNFSRPKEAHQKTLNWLWDLDSELYAWIRTGSGLFAVTGKPGSGKSVLMNEVATRLRKRHRHQFGVIVQYAFNGRGGPRERSLDGFLRFVISQVLCQRPSSFEAVVDEWVYIAHGSGLHGTSSDHRDSEAVDSTLWPISSLKKAVVAAVAHAARDSPVCFIIDALDECNDGAESTHELATFLRSLAETTPPTPKDNIRICFSSRDLPGDIGGHIAGSLRMEHRNAPDIAEYINDRWSSLQCMVEPGSNLKRLKTDLVKKADGIFLWAHLALERIQTALRDGSTLAELQETVNDIPEELGGLFALLLGSVNAKYKAETNTMLSITLSAGRPLTLAEFRYATALAMSPGTPSHPGLEQSRSFVPDDETMRKRMLSRCGGLLEVRTANEATGDEPTELVQFIHQSVRDSLLAGSNQPPSAVHGTNTLISDGHDALARCCLQYLSMKEVRELASHVRAGSKVDRLWRQRLQREFPFLDYAIASCFHHCHEAENRGVSHASLVGQIFAAEEEHFSKFIALRNAIHRGDTYSPGISLLQLAVEHDLASYVDMVLADDSADVNAVLDGGGNCIQIAVQNENVRTLKVLLAHGADVNFSQLSHSAKDEKNYYEPMYQHVRPLVVACQKGNVEMVELLLEHGAEVSLCHSYVDGLHINQALVSAACSGNLEVVRRLLDSDYSTLSHPEIRLRAIVGLSYASTRRWADWIATALRGNDRELEWKQSDLEKMRQISDLILSDIDLHQIGFGAGSKGSAAIFWYHTGCQRKVLQGLINMGTDLVGVDGISFLLAACVRGTPSAVQMLLQNGVDPHISLEFGDFHLSSIHAALFNETPAVLSYLLQQGVDPESRRNKSGGTALHDAADGATDDFIEVLLDHNADISARDAKGRRPLWFAAGNLLLRRPVDVLESLLSQDSDIQLADDEQGVSPLHVAAEAGALAAVEWLLSKGADPTAIDNSGRNALHYAASSPSVDSTDVLVLLLDYKPLTLGMSVLDINARDSADMTALHRVFLAYDPLDPECNSDPGIAIANAKQLLQRGADLDATDNAGNTPLHWAALAGIKELVRLLLRRGADPNACDCNGLRPLDLARMEDVREMLEDAMAASTN
ncbi:hypothetical protein B0T16DRAFT_220282 [Cercophora newfieldiana]|uniref:Nephrocystin 3-like N-terminal domain-containing protein n=1 Tax=Cercophora newfieldiana TaxID=92897 RepID=A0AA39XY92_9PEZI|nr:hypothetical protein B0T16DRAFT_220282 [Cercophora newfieldiana]